MHETPLQFCDDTTSTECTTGHRSVGTSTLRVRRYRARQRVRVRVLKLELPEHFIDAAIARGLLNPEDRAEAWPVIQGCYASLLSDATLDWLVNGKVITREQRGDTAAILRLVSTQRLTPNFESAQAVSK